MCISFSRAPTLSAFLKVSRFEYSGQVLGCHRWGLLGTWEGIKKPSGLNSSLLSEPVIISATVVRCQSVFTCLSEITFALKLLNIRYHNFVFTRLTD